MTDIYAHITIIDTNTGKIIPRNRFGWKFMAAAFIIGYNWQADRYRVTFIKSGPHMRSALCLVANQTWPLMRTIKERNQHVC